jgi:hypothetical protein
MSQDFTFQFSRWLTSFFMARGTNNILCRIALYEIQHFPLQSPHLGLILQFANQILDSRFPRMNLDWYALPWSFFCPFQETCFEPISSPQRLPTYAGQRIS